MKLENLEKTNLKPLLTWAVILMATAIILGALGAHFLKSKLTETALESFKTGVLYQLIGALGLLGIAANSQYFTPRALRRFGILKISGIACFSFSIYLLSTREITGMEFLRFLGPVTPLGGLMMIAAWLLLPFQYAKK